MLLAIRRASSSVSDMATLCIARIGMAVDIGEGLHIGVYN